MLILGHTNRETFQHLALTEKNHILWQHPRQMSDVRKRWLAMGDLRYFSLEKHGHPHTTACVGKFRAI
jgi:hypothetical protein